MLVRIHYFPAIYLVWGAVALSPLANANDERDRTQPSTVTIVVEADSTLLATQTATDRSSDSPKVAIDEVPLENVFVYLPELRSRAVGRAGLRDWLAAFAKVNSTGPTHHQFQMINGRISPPAMITRVGDTLGRSANGVTLGFEMFRNSAPALTVDVMPKYEFDSIEVPPFRVTEITGQHGEGYVLVIDHPVAKLTDAKGTVVFERLPVGQPLPMKITWNQLRGRKWKFESNTLAIRGNSFFLQLKQGEPQRHLIRVVPINPNSDE